MPARPEDLFARLAELGIATETHRHPPVFTVEEAKRLRGDIAGAHCKNLLLIDHKGLLWLVVAREDTPLDMKALRGRLGSGRLSFAKPERLREALGGSAAARKNPNSWTSWFTSTASPRSSRAAGGSRSPRWLWSATAAAGSATAPARPARFRKPSARPPSRPSAA